MLIRGIIIIIIIVFLEKKNKSTNWKGLLQSDKLLN